MHQNQWLDMCLYACVCKDMWQIDTGLDCNVSSTVPVLLPTAASYKDVKIGGCMRLQEFKGICTNEKGCLRHFLTITDLH